MRRSGPLSPAGDRHWRGSARLATACSLVFCAMTMLVDWNAGTLTTPRAVLWLTLSAAIFAVLLPPRITAGRGWLMMRGPLRRRVVRTDALVSVHLYADGVTAQLALRDAYGRRLQLDSRTLTASPLLWHELDRGLRRSLEHGTLIHGEDVLQRLGDQIDGRTAEAILRASGLS